ncbi:trimethylamine---corrinoid protein Co-methyltransferase [Desulforhopalus singaporensis]|uniref:Trimethylamine---corrinoid protein Co-methyltransferase n=1 Tax=Desulforhopalus singaporensis TaxID=91360 RepID=A0A1H0IYD0_9BACT|nr:trimethylamine---corrinoid protein Co-methyltransferase [Desulforhopalus singaporensis]
MTGLLAALAGTNLIYGPGMIESGMTFDYGQMVMDAEFVRMIKFAVGGIPINDDTLSVDLIKEVGQFKDYLAHENTFKNMRMYPQPKLMDRRRRGSWEADGSKDLYTRAMEFARDILAKHQPEPLSDHVAEELRAIVKGAEEELKIS